jgi:hypothetical protein
LTLPELFRGAKIQGEGEILPPSTKRNVATNVATIITKTSPYEDLILILHGFNSSGRNSAKDRETFRNTNSSDFNGQCCKVMQVRRKGSCCGLDASA